MLLIKENVHQPDVAQIRHSQGLTKNIPQKATQIVQDQPIPTHQNELEPQ
jgi:hypothetical protein